MGIVLGILFSQSMYAKANAKVENAIKGSFSGVKEIEALREMRIADLKEEALAFALERPWGRYPEFVPDEFLSLGLVTSLQRQRLFREAHPERILQVAVLGIGLSHLLIRINRLVVLLAQIAIERDVGQRLV